MISWIVTPAEVVLTNSTSLSAAVFSLVAVRECRSFAVIGAAAAIRLRIGREPVSKQRMSIINTVRRCRYAVVYVFTGHVFIKDLTPRCKVY